MQSSLGEIHYAPFTACPDLAFSSLEEIGKWSQVLLEKEAASRLFDKGKDSQEVVNLVEELRTAIAFYQVSSGHAVQTSINENETAITTTVDIQTDGKTDCETSHRSYLRP